jgi:hypothetical protein
MSRPSRAAGPYEGQVVITVLSFIKPLANVFSNGVAS